ncbi:hypothetical protein B0J17DRAFT_709706 [Rhizoctonia solani]|nr:hypothetical protein B0J17DRAFT_709706 [Rhizoctonia solani]
MLDIPIASGLSGLLFVFSRRVAQGRCSDPDHLIMEDASMMVRFVPLATDASTQDLLPDVVKHSIEYGRLLLLAQNDKDEIRLIVHTLPALNGPYRLDSSTKDRIIDTIRTGDLLNWVAVGMYKLDPSPAAFGERSMQAMGSFFGALAKIVSRSRLEGAFQDYAPDWRKFYRHLKATGSSVNVPCQNYYNACLQTW